MVQIRVEYLNKNGEKRCKTFYVEVGELINMLEYVYDNDTPAYPLLKAWVNIEIDDDCQEIFNIRYDWSPYGI